MLRNTDTVPSSQQFTAYYMGSGKQKRTKKAFGPYRWTAFYLDGGGEREKRKRKERRRKGKKKEGESSNAALQLGVVSSVQ